MNWQAEEEARMTGFISQHGYLSDMADLDAKLAYIKLAHDTGAMTDEMSARCTAIAEAELGSAAGSEHEAEGATQTANVLAMSPSTTTTTTMTVVEEGVPPAGAEPEPEPAPAGKPAAAVEPPPTAAQAPATGAQSQRDTTTTTTTTATTTTDVAAAADCVGAVVVITKRANARYCKKCKVVFESFETTTMCPGAHANFAYSKNIPDGVEYEVEEIEEPREAHREMAGFGPKHPDIALLEDNAVAELTVGPSSRIAASEATLSGSERHAARFMVRKGSTMWLGVIQGDWNVQEGNDARHVQGHCFYHTGSGHRYPGNRHWKGMQNAREEGDHIDLLLDLGTGSMTVFKNDERLGVMQESGLGGAGVEYRWAVLLNMGCSARFDVVTAAEVETRVQAHEEHVAQLERETAAAAAAAAAAKPAAKTGGNGKTRWPELVGLPGEEVVATISRQRPDLEVVQVPAGDHHNHPLWMTKEFKKDRVRVMINLDYQGGMGPRIGEVCTILLG
jgi:hypothetical protein